MMWMWSSGVARNSQWRIESIGAEPLAAEGKGSGAEPLALGDFICNFSIKITHFYAYFGQIAI